MLQFGHQIRSCDVEKVRRREGQQHGREAGRLRSDQQNQKTSEGGGPTGEKTQPHRLSYGNAFVDQDADVERARVMENCTKAEIEKIQRAQEGLLKYEIDVLEPHVVVFFTGPRYDPAIRAEFRDVEFRSFDGLPNSAADLSSLSLIRAPGLPVKTVRSYHPEYLQRSRRWGLISAIAEWAKS